MSLSELWLQRTFGDIIIGRWHTISSLVQSTLMRRILTYGWSQGQLRRCDGFQLFEFTVE